MAAKPSGPALLTRWCKLSSAGVGAQLENNNYLVSEHVRPSRQERFDPWIYRLAAYVFVSTLAALCYFNSLHGQLVHDDVFAIKNNPDVRQETSLVKLFRHDFWGRELTDNTSHKSYRPLTVLTFRLNHYLHGLNPLGYHVVNVLLHVLVTCLFTHVCVTRIFRMLSRPQFPAGYSLYIQCTRRRCGMKGLVLFGYSSEIQALSVSGVVGRADILSGLFILVAFSLYSRCLDEECGHFTHRWLMPLGGVVVSGAAMFVKETGVTVLGICIMYDVITHCLGATERSDGGFSYPVWVFRLLALLVVLLSLLFFRLWLMGGEIPRFTDQDNPASFSSSFSTRIMTYGFLAYFNIWLLLCPSTLSYDWQMSSIPLVVTWADTRNIATVTMVIMLVGLAYRVLFTHDDRDRRITCIGLLFLVVPFIPASNMFFPVGFVVAERILYVPSMGYIILLVHGLNRLTIKFRRKKRFFCRLMLLLLFLLAARTVIRNKIWQSRELLFLSGVQTLPHNAKMHYNYANLMKDMGDNRKAVQQYKETLRLWPNHASASNNLGTLTEMSDEAELYYNKAIQISQGTHAGAYFNLANLYYQQGRQHEALEHMKAAVRLDPECMDVYSSLVVMLEQAGRDEDAEDSYQKMLRMKQHDPQLLLQYAAFLGRKGHFERSFSVYREVYSRDTQNHQAMIHGARMLRSAGRMPEALALIDRVLQVDQSTTTYDAVGIFYFNIGNLERAMALFQMGLEKNDQNTDILVHLAQAYASSGRLREAERHGQRALQINPDHIEALQQMGKIYGVEGKHSKGLAYVTKALDLAKDKGLRAELFLDKGNHLKDLKEYQKAKQAFMEALSLNPDLFEAQLNTGVLYHIQGNYTMASFHYELAKRLDSNHVVLLENIRKLKKRR